MELHTHTSMNWTSQWFLDVISMDTNKITNVIATSVITFLLRQSQSIPFKITISSLNLPCTRTFATPCSYTMQKMN